MFNAFISWSCLVALGATRLEVPVPIQILNMEIAGNCKGAAYLCMGVREVLHVMYHAHPSCLRQRELTWIARVAMMDCAWTREGLPR